MNLKAYTNDWYRWEINSSNFITCRETGKELHSMIQYSLNIKFLFMQSKAHFIEEEENF